MRWTTTNTVTQTSIATGSNTANAIVTQTIRYPAKLTAVRSW